MYAMSLAKAVPDAELLDEFARRYPLHADALTEFAIELAIDALHAPARRGGHPRRRRLRSAPLSRG